MTGIKNIFGAFDGMSCGQVAFNDESITYYSSEISPYCVKVIADNFPDTIHLGDITKIDSSALPRIDLFIGGSPCTSFSFQGTGKGMVTKCAVELVSLEQYLDLKKRGFKFIGQSYLFWEYVRLLRELKPKYFLLENVKMSEKWKKVISETLGVEPFELNGKHFTPQNRPRLYWTNIPVDFDKLPPADNRKIIDMLDDNVDESYYLTLKQLSKLDLDFKWSENEIIRHKGGKHQQDNVYCYDGIMGCLSASTHGAARHLAKVYLPNGRIRRLTENEWARLQGFKKMDYTKAVTSSRAYEMYGNGWNIGAIEFIFSFIPK